MVESRGHGEVRTRSIYRGTMCHYNLMLLKNRKFTFLTIYSIPFLARLNLFICCLTSCNPFMLLIVNLHICGDYLFFNIYSLWILSIFIPIILSIPVYARDTNCKFLFSRGTLYKQ